MLAQDRYSLLSKALSEKKTIKISEAMKLCGVSHETVRHDLEILQDMGIARRVHGGAVLASADENSDDRPVIDSNYINPCNIAVAKKGAEFVQPGDVIYIGSGMTMSHLAQFLRDVEDLTVVTISMQVVNCFAGTGVHVYCLGGEFDFDENNFGGYLTESSFKAFNYTKAFFSCAGLNLKKKCISEYEMTGINRDLIREYADKTFLLLNHEKLSVDASVNFGSLNSVDTIIIDEMIGSDDKKTIEKLGIDVVVAPLVDIAK